MNYNVKAGRKIPQIGNILVRKHITTISTEQT
jgi:hypothetical protein